MPQSILEIAPPKPGIRIAYGADPNQFAELRLPGHAGPHPVAIFIHGGYWRAAYDLTHTGHLCVALNGAGFATWSVEYRRIGQPGGGYPGTMEDVRAAALHLKQVAKEHGLDLAKVVVGGHSAGGQLALWLAAQKAIELRGVVALAAVSDLRRAWELRLSNGVVGEFLGGPPERYPERYRMASPAELLPISAPQHLLHGTADDIVPFEFSERFAAASKNAKLTPLPGAGHFELIDPRSREWPAVKRAFSGFL
jgi:acetyl esterase/lipase